MSSSEILIECEHNYATARVSYFDTGCIAVTPLLLKITGIYYFFMGPMPKSVALDYLVLC